jgi:uncharacterized protein
MKDTPDLGCWLSSHVEPRASRISGDGLFATEDIEEDVVVSRLGGRIVTNAALHLMMQEAGDTYIDTVSVFDDGNLLLPPGSPNHFGNHSCDPNLWWVDPFSLATRSAVAGGSELTVDYGTLTDDPEFRMWCRCGAPGCRHVITGVDWSRSDLQARYGGHWVPVLRKRIYSARHSSE